MALNVAAYALDNRSSDFSADVVARLGFVPDRVERKMTIGQQRRGTKRQRGRGGTAADWRNFQHNALAKYAKHKGIKEVNAGVKKAVMIGVFTANTDASVADLHALIADGTIKGGKANYLAGKAPVTQEAFIEARREAAATVALADARAKAHEDESALSAAEMTVTSEDEGDTSARGTSDDTTLHQPQGITHIERPLTRQTAAIHPADDVVPSSTSVHDESVRETTAMQLSTRSIMDQSGFNSLNEIDSQDDVVHLQETIEAVADTPPEGYAATLWAAATAAAGLNVMKAVVTTADLHMVRVQAEAEVNDVENAHILALANSHVDTVNQSLSGFESAHASAHGASTIGASEPSSGVDVSTAGFGDESSVFGNSDDLVGEIRSNMNESLAVHSEAIAEPLNRAVDMVAQTNQLMQTLGTDQLAAIAKLAPDLQTKLVTARQLQAGEMPRVLKVLQDDPDVAELLRQGLVQPEQLKDEAYVASLRKNLLKNRAEGRSENVRGRIRGAKVPVFARQVQSKRTPGLAYYRPPTHAAPSIFAP